MSMPGSAEAADSSATRRFRLRKRASIAAVLALAALVLAADLRATQSDRSLTATGTITKIQSTDRSFAVTLADGSQSRFVWTSDTKISGVLAPGAKVTIRYEVAADGRNVAQQVSVSRS